MVSLYPNPPPDQDFSNFYGFHMGEDPIKLPGVDGNELNSSGSVDDPNKKIRKPYTITKSRESWTEQEHDKFLEALHLFDRDWKKIEAFVGSKTVIQIRSHAQKYFLKVQRNGTSEHVPPPRPKRKAAHPYPQKAPQNVVSPAPGILQSLGAKNQIAGWAYNVAPPGPSKHIRKGDIELASVGSTKSTPRMWTSNEAQLPNSTRGVMPDFAQVYSFIGSVFDPTARGQLQRLKEMDPINLETALMLMKNLAVNLISPEFEDHRRLISSYNSGGRATAITSVY